MGQRGVDVEVSDPRFPFAVECKNQQSLDFWKAITQAEYNAGKTNNPMLLVFKKNHSKTYAIMEWPILLELLKEKPSVIEDGGW